MASDRKLPATQPNVTLVHHNHITQLRAKLEEALNALHLPIGTYEHPGPNANDPIYAIDFQELRTKIKDAWTALASTSSLTQAYDGDGLRVKKTEYGWSTFYLRSGVLGGQVISEIGVSAIGGTAEWQRGYVYAGSGLMAVQQQGGVFWTYEDPVTKSKRVTDINGTVVSGIETDPWGADTNRSSNQAFQPKRFTSYDRDGNQSDEAMFRRYNRKDSRFVQPDPYGGSYNFTDPQSFNRYTYVQNDPVNFVDPSGLCPEGTMPAIDPETGKEVCISDSTWEVTVTDNWDDMSDYLPDWRFSDLFFLIRPVLSEAPLVHTLESPHQQRGTTPPANRQQPTHQKEFDNCVKKAWRQFHKGYWKNVGKMFAGVGLTMAGYYVAYRGIPGGGPGGGIGISAMRTSQGLEGAAATGKAGVYAGLSVASLGSLLIGSSFAGSKETFTGTLDAFNNCKSQFPNANHSVGRFGL